MISEEPQLKFDLILEGFSSFIHEYTVGFISHWQEQLITNQTTNNIFICDLDHTGKKKFKC